MARSGKIAYTPPVPDGPDCPWLRGRRTRWWLVVPADAVSVALVAALCGGALHDVSQIPEILVWGCASVAVSWLVSWRLTRPQDHLEAAGISGWIVMGLTWLWLLVARVASGGADDLAEGISFATMTAFMMVVTMGGWRWLYGFAKAQESVTPRAIRKRLEAQETEESGTSDAAS